MSKSAKCFRQFFVEISEIFLAGFVGISKMFGIKKMTRQYHPPLPSLTASPNKSSLLFSVIIGNHIFECCGVKSLRLSKHPL